jgi:hypothetical protein
MSYRSHGSVAFVLAAIVVLLSSCGGGGQSPQSNSNNGSNNSSGGGSNNNNNNPPAAAVVVSVAGASSEPAGGTSAYSATVQNASNQAVTWEINGTTGGNSTVGTINAAGAYTAPLLPPAGGTVTITAVSQADSTKSASMTVAVLYSNASIQGPYVFSVGGNKLGVQFSTVGSFKADGKGNISAGELDTSSPGVVDSNLTFSGTYSVGSDGRGSATLTSTQGSDVYRFVVLATGRLQFIGFDNSQVATGYAILQDISALSLSALATYPLPGGWVFQASGGTGTGYTVTTGQFTIDAMGNIPVGEEDIQVLAGKVAGNTYSAITFTNGVSSKVDSSSGRGTFEFTTPPGVGGCVPGVCIGTINAFTYYVVSANELLMAGGVAYKQQGAPFSQASFTGSYINSFAGVDSAGRSAAFLGQFSVNQCGSITGSVDGNDNGTVALNQTYFGSVCVLGANGRGAVSVFFAGGSRLDLVFYIVSSNQVEFMEMDTNGTVAGPAIAQSGSPFSNASISGSFGLIAGGFNTSGALDVLGTLKVSGSLAGTLSGTEDVNLAGTVQTGVALTGTYSVANSQTSRGTAAISGNGATSNLVFYVVSPGHAMFLDVDATELTSGFIDQQY